MDLQFGEVWREGAASLGGHCEEDRIFPDDLYANFVLLRLPDDEESIRFLEYLQQQHGLYYTYTMRHLQADVQKSMEDLSNNTDLLFIVSIILLIVVATGLIGILLIFTNSRKKDMAIAQVYGASGKQIRTEFFIEIAFLYIVGCIIGICASGVLAPSFSTALFVVRFQPLSIINRNNLSSAMYCHRIYYYCIRNKECNHTYNFSRRPLEYD